MKKLWKRLGCAVLAAAMLVGMGVTAMADEPAVAAAYQNIDFEVTGVASGDTVTAYRLLSYATNYNSMTPDANFKEYVEAQDDYRSQGVEDYLVTKNTDDLKKMLGAYQNACATDGATYSLPTTKTEREVGETGSVTFSLGPGYYMFLSKTITKNSKVYQTLAVFVRVNAGEIEVYTNGDTSKKQAPYKAELKSQNAPVIQKRVNATKVSENKKWMKTAAAGVNDVVTFYVALDIPNYTNISGLNLTLQDTLTNMEYIPNSAEVYNKGPNNQTEIEETPQGDFINESVNKIQNAISNADSIAETYANGTQKLTIPLAYDKIMSADAAEAKIWVVYKARVKKEAVENDEHFGENTVQLEYSNMTTNSPVLKTPEQSTTVYNYSLQLNKIDKDGNPLNNKGAKFTFKEGTNTVKFVAVKKTDSEEVDYYRPYVENVDEQANAITEVPADFTIKGLDGSSDKSYYTVEETSTPEGYYKPKNAFKLYLYSDHDENDAHNGNLADNTVMSGDDGLVAGNIDETKPYQYNVKVKNSTTPTLPTTGGKGTALFTIAGVALMAAAAYLFFFRRKKESK